MSDQNIIGKTIAKVQKMKKPPYDDTGWLELTMTDGTVFTVVARYGSYTAQSEREHPTRISLYEGINEELIPIS